ncbi:FecR family protein [Dyadobacter sp. Leaf189]|uniref:FecR family protein n=1 Tax=Dyadobacter sp. Leaf189 TaxID=1736295 RepID=UPI0006F1D933|nr:FecR family protein [Dyadobacter sp. Leaf189]KQS30620.1 hypothetical protein ASG33_09495 [Dyadobacter sp. Leaf189]
MIKNLSGFLKLLNRYQNKQVDADEKQAMDLWYDSINFSEENKSVLSEDQAGKAMWAAIEGKMDNNKKPATHSDFRPRFRNMYIKLAAACMLLVIGLVAYRTLSREEQVIAGVRNEVLTGMQEAHNAGSKPMSFTLSDGSKAVLEPGASLYYPVHFNAHERTVFLKGDVFFEVAHDPSRPFFVHANNIITKVLGTSFTVRENSKTKSIEVAVMTGVVEVRRAEAAEENELPESKVVLTQNKKVTFFKEGEKLVTGLVEKPTLLKNNALQIDRAEFNYAGASLPDIVKILENAYGVKILLQNEKLRNCNINADLSQENTLFSQLEILCESISAEYQLTGDTITLVGPGCPPLK